jgi:predicted metal-dependent hydrolase
MNHSMAFWQIVKNFHPSYKAEKKWLHEYGHLLNWD